MEVPPPFSPPPPPFRDQANPFACSCSFTLQTSFKNGMLGQRGKDVKIPQNKLLHMPISHKMCTNL